MIHDDSKSLTDEEVMYTAGSSRKFAYHTVVLSCHSLRPTHIDALFVVLAGADTTLSTVQSFILAMLLYPEVQKKAQEELDRVVGTDRLPTFADRDNLPYLEALVSEVHRWMPVSPMGM